MKHQDVNRLFKNLRIAYVSIGLDIEAWFYLLKLHFGAHGDEETPVPIPNTEVKLISGDYTA